MAGSRLFGVVGSPRHAAPGGARAGATPITSSSTDRPRRRPDALGAARRRPRADPVQPSPLDGWASAEMLALIGGAHLSARTWRAFVLNRCGARTVIARETAETLADHDPPVLAATIGQRVAFAAAAQSGASSPNWTTTRPPRARSRRWRMRRRPRIGGRHERASVRRGFASGPPIPTRWIRRPTPPRDAGAMRLHRPAHHRRDAGPARPGSRSPPFRSRRHGRRHAARLLAREFCRRRPVHDRAPRFPPRAGGPMPRSHRRPSHPCRADLGSKSGSRTGSGSARKSMNRCSIAAAASSLIVPAASSPSFAGPPTTSARPVRASTSCAPSRGRTVTRLPFVRPGRRHPAGRSRAGQGRTGASPGIDAVEALGIDPATSRPITGGMSATGWRRP